MHFGALVRSELHSAAVQCGFSRKVGAPRELLNRSLPIFELQQSPHMSL